MSQSEHPSPAQLRYIPALDGLRGAAVIAVLLFHGGHLRGGYLGVDLFFVLSGFLITSLLLVEGERSHHIGLAHFWERRARRLLPALGVMLLGVAAYAKFAAQPEELHRIRFDGLATIFYVANWRDVLARTNYFDLFTAPSPLAHTWSLAIEEQFYLLWPVVFVAILAFNRSRGRQAHGPRRLAGQILVLVLALGSISAALTLFDLDRGEWNRAYFGTDTRAFAVLAGAALAACIARYGNIQGRKSRWALEGFGLIGAAILLYAWMDLAETTWLARHGFLMICSVAGMLVIAAAVNPQRGLLARTASFAPLRWMGLISYGVYLYHWPIFVWLNADRVHLKGWALFSVQVALTVGIAVVSYFLVEQPIRTKSGWPRAANVLVPASGVVVVGLLIVLSTLGAAEVPSTDSPDIQQAVAHSGEPKGTSVMVVGNSVGWYLANDGLARVTKTPATSIANAARVGCSEPGTDLFGEPSGRTTKAFTTACDTLWEKTAAAVRPTYVLYVRDAMPPFLYHYQGKFISVCSPTFRDWYAQRLTDAAQTFSALGSTFVLVTSLPNEHAPVVPDLGDVFSRSTYLDNTKCGNDIIRQVAADNPSTVRLIDLEAMLCSEPDACDKKLNGVTLRSDGTHYKSDGAQALAVLLLRKLGIHATVPS